MSKQKCWNCNGTGKRICYSCGGTGSKRRLNLIYIPMIGCPLPEVTICETCHATGKADCPYCHGTGERP